MLFISSKGDNFCDILLRQHEEYELSDSTIAVTP